MKTECPLLRCEPLTALAVIRGDLPQPNPDTDEHPFVRFAVYVRERCQRWSAPPHVAPDANEDCHYDPALADAFSIAWRIGLELRIKPPNIKHSLLTTTRVRIRELREYCRKLETENASPRYDVEGLEDQERALSDAIRLRQHCDLALAETGDREALQALVEDAELHLRAMEPRYLPFAIGGRLVLSGEDLREWRDRPLGVIRAATTQGHILLDERDRLARVAEGRVARDAAGGGDLDDDRAGIVRVGVGSGAPSTGLRRVEDVLREAQEQAKAETPPVPTRSLVVFPTLEHLPLPSKNSRERGDSPRALCEDVAGVPLPLAPAPDPAAFRAGLDAAFPWASEVTEQYAQDLVGAPYAQFRPRIIVGGAGGGKTSYARALFATAGLPETVYGAAGQMDGGNFSGTSRTWSTWRLSVPAQAMLRFRLASVGLVIDEADKGSPSRRYGRLDEALLPFLERATTARGIHDPALECGLDLSGASYVITANSLADVSRPLLDRAPPVQWPMPRAQDLASVAAAILDELRRERSLDEAWCPPLDGNELDALTAWRGGSMRPLRRMVEAVLASREHFARQQPN